MRSDWLLFLHVLSSMLLLGTATTVAIAILAVPRQRENVGRSALIIHLAYRLNMLGSIPLAVAAIGFGEGLKAKEDAEGTWLSVGSGLTYVAVLVGALVLHGYLRRGVAHTEAGKPPAVTMLRGAGAIAPAIVAALLVVAFLMTGKP